MPRNAALSVGAIAGKLIPFFAPGTYRDAVRHLTIAFGNEKSSDEIRKIARTSFIGLAMNFVDTARLQTMSPEEINSVCVTHNLERLQNYFSQGKGAIGLTSHGGCWELLGAFISLNGIPLSVIARKVYDNRFEKIIAETREGKGVRNITRGQDTREIIRSLREGRLLGVLIDQDMKVRGDFVDFFGKPAHTATAPAGLSLKYGVPIFPILTYMDDERQHHVCVGEEVKIEKTGDMEKDILALTAKCLKVNEMFIREHPGQWVWFANRWKTQPKGISEIVENEIKK